MRGTAETELRRARAAYGRRAWSDAHALFSHLDRLTPLGAADLERLAISACLTNREEDCQRAFERCHLGWLGEGQPARAARAAFWLGFRLAACRQTGPATGWFGRAGRLLEGGPDCVERGYLLVPVVEERLSAGSRGTALEAAREEAAIGARFRDQDLVACALHQQGRVLIRDGDTEAGLALLDEAMVAVVADGLSPLMTGLIYCSVIQACSEIYAFGRARQWTSALARWCGAQPQIVAFTGACLVHRAEIMQLGGAWQDAAAEAGRACERFQAGIDPQPPAPAYYRSGEMHRLRGEHGAAEADYRRASQFGCEPQPGLALLRLAQGRTAAARAAIRRVLGATADSLLRTRLLPAQVEIALAAGAIEEADGACRELERTAAVIGPGVPEAIAGHARGAVLLARGEAEAALVPLRRALAIWQEIGAPYEAARSRVLIGLACAALGDRDGSELELDAARAAFDGLGAGPDRARVEALAGRRGRTGGLTRRELQVLRLVAAGKTNGAIAADLFLSGRTVERHLSNIFTKLDVPTRAAATAWAYEHRVI